MTLPRPALIGGAIIALLIAVYATFQLGANQQTVEPVDTSEINALRQGDMKKLIFASAPVAPVTTAFTDEAQTPKTFADYKGKYVLVNFWATWCAPCRKEMPSLNKLQRELGGDKFEVVTIATGHNPLPAIKTFFSQANITDLPILLDPKQDLARQMSVFGLPATVILDPQGREIARLRGDAEWADDNAYTIIKALIATQDS
ncbi:TlpA family protein disulfide reductase [Amylibacter sp. IMCC11727]|uniref:TlpA disulfide reductase family protein n=1 Tax=Amylibacter sp. IMCC11727 TaxID=3039851 RepID=UPI00244E573E|nr:TlpA family protein disulfide reductase [Amylibacter sp. IMCC11727]WGI21639.1 redoxin domain-containing protein [Amylibacter sp. IMCC11727]